MSLEKFFEMSNASVYLSYRSAHGISAIPDKAKQAASPRVLVASPSSATGPRIKSQVNLVKGTKVEFEKTKRKAALKDFVNKRHTYFGITSQRIAKYLEINLRTFGSPFLFDRVVN